jgi:hypothetical protein
LDEDDTTLVATSAPLTKAAMRKRKGQSNTGGRRLKRARTTAVESESLDLELDEAPVPKPRPKPRPRGRAAQELTKRQVET